MKKIKCPVCDGKGWEPVFSGDTESGMIAMKCNPCKGTGLMAIDDPNNLIPDENSASSPTQQKIEKRFYNIKDLTDLTSLSSSTIWRMETKGSFPKRIKIGGRVFWKVEEIDTWIRNFPA